MGCVGILDYKEFLNALSHSFIHLFNNYLRTGCSVRENKMTDESGPISALVGMSGTLLGGGITLGGNVEQNAQ